MSFSSTLSATCLCVSTHCLCLCLCPHGVVNVMRFESHLKPHTSNWISFFFSSHIPTVCVFCFVLLTRYWGIVTVPGSIPFGSRPGVAGSSPFTLNTSLAIPVPSSSSSNGPTTVTVITMGLCHGSSATWAGPMFVRTHR